MAVSAAAGISGAGLGSCSTGSPAGAGHSPATSSSRPSSTSPQTRLAPSTSTSSSPAGGSAGSAWTTYGGGFSRTSYDSADPAFTTAPTEAWRSSALDGPVYGEPIVYKGGVYVATENDTVYAFSTQTGKALWAPDHLASPASSSSLPCGDISPTVGVTSTMVLDPATGVLFASGETSSGGGVGHHLYAIDTTSGRVLWSRDVDQSWDAAAQLQRAALAISNGNVVVGFGGNYGDCGSYNGWVLAVPESGGGAILRYKVPTARGGAVWAPGGVAVDASGDVYIATGNGSASSGSRFDHGDAVIELSPELRELQYFAPNNWAQLNESDSDLGSTAPVLLGDGRIFTIGKGGSAYLLNASVLGGIGGQLASVGVCPSIGASAYLSPYAYVTCADDGRIAQVQIGPGNSLRTGWSWSSPGGGAGSPTVAGGVLWSVATGSSTLYGVNLSNGHMRFSVHLNVGSLPHYAGISAAAGMLFVAGSGEVEGFFR